MLKNARVSEHEGQFGLQRASELHVGRLGRRWAGRLIKPPRGAPGTHVLPSPHMILNIGLRAGWGIMTYTLRRGIGVGLLGACRGAGRTFWRQFHNSEQFCSAA